VESKRVPDAVLVSIVVDLRIQEKHRKHLLGLRAPVVGAATVALGAARLHITRDGYDVHGIHLIHMVSRLLPKAPGIPPLEKEAAEGPESDKEEETLWCGRSAQGIMQKTYSCIRD